MHIGIYKYRHSRVQRFIIGKSIIQRYNIDVYFGIFEVFLCPTWNVVLNYDPRRRRILSMTLFTRK